MAEAKAEVPVKVQTTEPEPTPESVPGKFAEKSQRSTLDRKP